MRLFLRKYQNDSDYVKIRDFLREIYLLHNRREVCWPVYRWDYWYWNVNANMQYVNLSAAIFLWENSEGKLVSMLHPDSKGSVFLQVHPDYHSPELDVEMISIAETQYTVVKSDGNQYLSIWSHESDLLRKDILTRRGYTPKPETEFRKHRLMEQPIPNYPIPAGFTIHSLEDIEVKPARCWPAWKASLLNEPETLFNDNNWHDNIIQAPLYRKDLDLVAVAQDGEIASFCTVWYDPETQTAAFGPVGSFPKYHGMGLTRAVMTEGLRRAQSLGATQASVGSSSKSAGALYTLLGFTKNELSEPWIKVW